MTENETAKSDIDVEQLNKLFEAFLPKLIRQAENRIADRYKQKFDGNDIAATVCRTVFRRFKEGKFKFGDDAELWRLMTTISIRKISNKVRAENTQGRSIDREVDGDPEFQLALSREPSPEDSAQFVDLLERLGQHLDTETMEVLNLRLTGMTAREIADQLGVVERTVTRKLAVIKEELLDQV
jgi:RNA polymerase sigma factor (sigma-70 family)